MSTPFIIVRGAPGAGKSTFARMLQHRLSNGALIFETDNFFVDRRNHRDYHFDPKLLGLAHSWNQGEVICACRDFPDVPVIVANTFKSVKKEIFPYLKIADMFKRPVYIFTLMTAHDNEHGVPEDIVKRYRDNMEQCDLATFEGCPLSPVYTRSIYTHLDADYYATAFSQWIAKD